MEEEVGQQQRLKEAKRASSIAVGIMHIDMAKRGSFSCLGFERPTSCPVPQKNRWKVGENACVEQKSYGTFPPLL